jgi:thymidylate synthase
MEKQYLDLVKKVLEQPTRSTRNGTTKSLFFSSMSFDLTKGFPLLTTKKMFFRGIVEELLFFLSGQTNSKLLEEKNVNIWKGNTSREFLDHNNMSSRKEGMLGPLYGYQWRSFNALYNEETGLPQKISENDIDTNGIDQLLFVINTIQKDPNSRRILMTTYNPEQAPQGVLYPCHSIINQFYVRDGYLDMFCYNRSQDLFLGTPFNIASSALLLSIIANLTDLKPGFLHMSLGDVHIYEEHFKEALEQSERVPYDFPNLTIPYKLNLETISYKDFVLEKYNFHPPFKVVMKA